MSLVYLRATKAQTIHIHNHIQKLVSVLELLGEAIVLRENKHSNLQNMQTVVCMVWELNLNLTICGMCVI